MPFLTFYHQVRQDNGVRTGIAINDIQHFMSYMPGDEDNDPALNWYLDVRCKGKAVPTEPGAARDWLLRNASVFREGLIQFADQIQAGIDSDVYPVQRDMDNAPANSTVILVCAAARRMTALRIGDEITKVAKRWEKIIRQLSAVAPAEV